MPFIEYSIVQTPHRSSRPLDYTIAYTCCGHIPNAWKFGMWRTGFEPTNLPIETQNMLPRPTTRSTAIFQQNSAVLHLYRTWHENMGYTFTNTMSAIICQPSVYSTTPSRSQVKPNKYQVSYPWTVTFYKRVRKSFIRDGLKNNRKYVFPMRLVRIIRLSRLA